VRFLDAFRRQEVQLVLRHPSRGLPEGDALDLLPEHEAALRCRVRSSSPRTPSQASPVDLIEVGGATPV